MSQEITPAVIGNCDVNGVIASVVKRLQGIGDQKAVSDIVYDFLNLAGLNVPEAGAEILCGAILGMIDRVRSGKDDPTNETVIRELTAMANHAKGHNAHPHLTTKLALVDLDAANDALLQCSIAGIIQPQNTDTQIIN